LTGFFHLSRVPPLLDFGMVSGKQDFWNGHAPEFGGTRVLRKVEQLAGEAFVRQ
jgi:hypothetical protein